MARPVVENWNTLHTAGVAADNIDITVPTDLAENELWLVFCGDDADGDTNNWDDITGFTKDVHSGNGTSDCHVQSYYKIAGASESTVNFTHNGVSDELWAFSIRVSGVNYTVGDPLGKKTEGIPTTGNNIRVYVSAGFFEEANVLQIYCVGFDGGEGYPFSVSSNWTQKDQVQSGTGGNDASGAFGIANNYSYAQSYSTSGTMYASDSDGLCMAVVGVRAEEAVVDQTGFRARNDDGTESTATWMHDLNTDWTQAADENFRVRFLVENSEYGQYRPNPISGRFETNDIEYKLNSGSWTRVGAVGTTADAVVVSLTSHWSGYYICQQRIGSSSNFEDEGTCTEDSTKVGIDSRYGQEGASEVETEVVMQILGDNVSSGDEIQLRIVGLAAGDVTQEFDAYTEVPTITVGGGLTHYSETALAGTISTTGQISRLAHTTAEDIRDENQLGINDVDYWDTGDALITDQSDYLELEVP